MKFSLLENSISQHRQRIDGNYSEAIAILVNFLELFLELFDAGGDRPNHALTSPLVD